MTAGDPNASEVGLSLASSGATLDTWDEYAVTLDMLAPGSPFTFALWRSETRSSTWDVLRRSVKCMDAVSLRIDGVQQLNGRIERIETSADGHGEARMVISGRDLAGPALDWDADPTLNVAGMTLENALRRIFAGVGIPLRVTSADAAVELSTKRRAPPSPPPVPLADRVRRALQEAAALPALADAGRAPLVGVGGDITPLERRRASARRRAAAIRQIIIPAAHPRPGERVWGFAESITARVGALMWVAPDPDGGVSVVVDAPDNAAPASYAFTRVVRGNVGDPSNNILALSETIDTREVPTTVNIYTGSERGDRVSARQRAEVINAQLTTSAINRGFVVDEPPEQPRHMRSTRAKTLARAGREGQRVICDAMRSFRGVTLVVRGHAQVVGGTRTLYGINTVAHVVDSVCTAADGSPLDEDMLITRVTFKRTRAAGTTTELRLMPRGALYVEPEGV